MTRLRSILVLGVVVAGAVGAAASIFVVNRDPGDALRSLVAVQAGTIAALAVTVWVLLGPTVARLDELVEALRAFARGERQTRVNPVDFAGLADVARAVNDVGASMCENDDPNLGPIQRRPREKPVRRPSSDGPRPSSAGSGPIRRPTLEDIADAPGVGEVRRHRPSSASVAAAASAPSTSSAGAPRVTSARPASPPAEAQARVIPSVAAPPAPESLPAVVDVSLDSVVEPAQSELPAPIMAREGVSEPRVSRKDKRKARKAANAASTVPTSATTPPTSVSDDDAPQRPIEADGDESEASISDSGVSASGELATIRADESVSGLQETAPATDLQATDPPATIVESVPPAELPGRAELQALFEEFRREKRGAGQGDNGDLDFDAFAETILSESERLVVEHQCRGVRFEVAVADGEVSLRPRLLR
jgi:hypothetical protein